MKEMYQSITQASVQVIQQGARKEIWQKHMKEKQQETSQNVVQNGSKELNKYVVARK